MAYRLPRFGKAVHRRKNDLSGFNSDLALSIIQRKGIGKKSVVETYNHL